MKILIALFWLVIWVNEEEKQGIFEGMTVKVSRGLSLVGIEIAPHLAWTFSHAKLKRRLLFCLPHTLHKVLIRCSNNNFIHLPKIDGAWFSWCKTSHLFLSLSGMLGVCILCLCLKKLKKQFVFALAIMSLISMSTMTIWWLDHISLDYLACQQYRSWQCGILIKWVSLYCIGWMWWLCHLDLQVWWRCFFHWRFITLWSLHLGKLMSWCLKETLSGT